MHIGEDNCAEMSNFYFELIGRFGTKCKNWGKLYEKIGNDPWIKGREQLRQGESRSEKDNTVCHSVETDEGEKEEGKPEGLG